MAKNFYYYNKSDGKLRFTTDKKKSSDSYDQSKFGVVELDDKDVDKDKINIGYDIKIENGNITYTKKITKEDITLDLKKELGKAQSIEEIKKVVEKLL